MICNFIRWFGIQICSANLRNLKFNYRVYDIYSTYNLNGGINFVKRLLNIRYGKHITFQLFMSNAIFLKTSDLFIFLIFLEGVYKFKQFLICPLKFIFTSHEGI